MSLFRATRALGLLLSLELILAGCGLTQPVAVGNPTPAAKTLILYNWEDDLSQDLLDTFEAQTDIHVLLQTFSEQGVALEGLSARQPYDLVVVNSPFIPQLQRQGLLSPIDASQIANLQYMSPAYRDQSFGLTKRYAVPYSYGSIGLVVRPDRLSRPIRSWSDLWDPKLAGRVGIWKDESRETIALTLKTLGYSANSEDPAELQRALEKLLQIRWNVVFLEDYAQIHSGSPLGGDDLDMIVGYAKDVRNGQEEGLKLDYIYPEEGALLWVDAFVIPANAPNQSGAESFLNFVLQPEISARITNETLYAAPVDLARDFVRPELLNNPMIYPTPDMTAQAEIILPLSPAGENLYQEIWNKFLTASRQDGVTSVNDGAAPGALGAP